LEQLDDVVHVDLMPGIRRPEAAIRILTINSLQLTHYPKDWNIFTLDIKRES
jgi:hypothetical protein